MPLPPFDPAAALGLAQKLGEFLAEHAAVLGVSPKMQVTPWVGPVRLDVTASLDHKHEG